MSAHSRHMKCMHTRTSQRIIVKCDLIKCEKESRLHCFRFTANHHHTRSHIELCHIIAFMLMTLITHTTLSHVVVRASRI